MGAEAGAVPRAVFRQRKLNRPAVATALAALGTLVSAGGASAASPAVSGSPTTPVITQGAKLQLAITARAGSKRTDSSTLRLLLSTDRKASKSDVALKPAKIPALGPKKSKTLRVSAAVPKKAKPDRYYVFACTSPTKCRALVGTVGVSRAVTRVNVSLTADATRAQSKLITRSGGGEIDAEGPDGTRYSLVVPAGALPGDTSVTMTPVTGASGLPFSGLVGAVRLEPAGLQLDGIARLLIRRPGLGTSGTAAFGSSGGRDLFLTQWAKDSLGADTLAVPVTHFSAWGVVSLTQTQTAAQHARSAFRAQDRIAQDFHQADDRQAAAKGSATAYVEQVVRPLFEAAVLDPAFLDDAIRAQISIQRQAELLFMELAEDPVVKALFAKALKRYVDVLVARCEQADFTVIAEAVSLARQISLLRGLDGPGEFAAVLARFKRCLRFELRLVSNLESSDDAHHSVTGTAAVVPLELDGWLERTTGGGPLEYTQARNNFRSGCDRTISTRNSTLNVLDGGMNLLELVPPGPGKPAVVSPTAWFSVDPGSPAERQRYENCFSGDPGVEQDYFHWEGNFRTLHQKCSPGSNQCPDALTISGFTGTGTPGVLARATFSGTFYWPGPEPGVPPVTAQETWEIVHVPEVGG